MKKFGIIIIAMLALASCSAETSIGIIGGADGPTAVVVSSKSDSTALTAMPEIAGLPTPPGDFDSAARSDKNTFINMENVTDVMLSVYVSELENAGFDEKSSETDDGVTVHHLESDEMTVVLIHENGQLTVTVTEK